MAREKAEKVKVKKIREKKSLKERLSSLVFSLISIIVAGGLFVGLIFLLRYFSTDVTYKAVVCAKTDVPEGEIITEDNLASYFEIKDVNAMTALKDGLTDTSVLLNQKAKVTLSAGEEVSLKDFTDLNPYIESIENPVEVSVQVSSISASDGGKIRAGDVINITLMYDKSQLPKDEAAEEAQATYSVIEEVYVAPSVTEEVTEGVIEETAEETDTELAEEITETEETVETEEVPSATEVVEAEAETEVEEVSTEETVSEEGASVQKGMSVYNYTEYSQYILENIYISKVLTADGTEIEPTDTTTNAFILVFAIPKDFELELNNALTNCSSMRISKVLNIAKAGTKVKQEFVTEDAAEETAEEVTETAEPMVEEAVTEEPVQETVTEEISEEAAEEAVEETVTEELAANAETVPNP